MKLNFATLILAGALALSGCGDDDSNETVNTGGGTAGPLATPTPTPTPGPVAPWNTVRTEVFTDMIDQDQCDMPFRFRVERDGDYRAGPCTNGSEEFKTGKLTAEERAQLDARARAVGIQNLNDQTCTTGEAIAGSRTWLRKSSGEFRVFRDDPDQYCYRGTEAAAKDLHEFLVTLQYQYYPKKSDF